MIKIYMKITVFFISNLLLCTVDLMSSTIPIPIDTDHDGYYNISNIDELRWISENDSSWSWNFELDNDIDASSTKYWNEGKGWSPIGNEEKPFTGIFDGKGYSISKIYINEKGQSHYSIYSLSFWGFVEGIVENLSLSDIDYMVNQSICSGFAHSINNSTITNCHISGQLLSNLWCIGFIQNVTNSQISHCSVNCELVGSDIFSFSYTIDSSLVRNCMVDNNIVYRGYCTGFSAKFFNSRISQSSISNHIQLKKIKTEGLYTIGYYDFCEQVDIASQVDNCSFHTKYDIPFYNFSQRPPQVHLADEYVNVSKHCFGIHDFDNKKIILGYYSSSYAKKVKKIGVVINDKQERLSSTQEFLNSLQTKQTYIDAGWDFENIWDIDPNKNDGYPFLRNVPLFDEE